MSVKLLEKYPHMAFAQRWDLKDVDFQLGQCDAMVKAICKLPILPHHHQELLMVSLKKGAQATTAIEGNTLTDEEIVKVQQGESLAPSKHYQEVEVRNVMEAFNNLLRNISNSDGQKYITPTLLENFHRMIGKDLGEHLDAIPGRFRQDMRIVGPYRAPDVEDVVPLVNKLCDWLREQFHFGKDQSFKEAIIESIVAHVYIEWIHPFADGNGRTGRLVEFYILMRAGAPSIASHILSNFYNETRSEYYRQFNIAYKTRDLTQFIKYAVQGYRDGLYETLQKIQSSLLLLTWQKYIYDQFADYHSATKIVAKRRRDLVLNMPFDQLLSPEELILSNTKITRMYAGEKLSSRTIYRDLKELIMLNLVIKEGKKYKANVSSLTNFLPAKNSKM